MRNQTKLVLIILAVWFGLSLTAGIWGSFQNASAPRIALIVWTLTGIALLICRIIPGVRNWAAIVDLRWLVAVHLTRFVGVYFLVLASRAALPRGFAKPAGIGDIIVAFIAGLILLVPQLGRRKILLIWNTLGLVDIIFVVFSALRFGVRDWSSMRPLRELPLGLLPTFLVPLIVMTHVLIYSRLRRGQFGPTAPLRHSSSASLLRK